MRILRGSSLNRSLLVIDEVHASDTYMTEVLARLLKGPSRRWRIRNVDVRDIGRTGAG